MQHNYYLYYMIDRLLGEDPQYGSVIEIGTGAGALSIVLGLAAARMDTQMLTVDQVQMFPVKLFNWLCIEFVLGDEWSASVIGRIEDVIAGKPTFFVCDGGDKIREINFWTPRLPTGSMICAHDWSIEINEADIQPEVREKLEPILPELWMKMNVLFAAFRIV